MPLLCSDVIFKSIFIKHTDVLSKFIYDITGIRLNNISLVVNELPITRNHEKFKRCDFLISNNNYIFNIELNSSYSKTLLIKNTSYIFNLFSSHASCGEVYQKDLKIIQININNFSRFHHSMLDYKLLNDNYYYVYLDSLKIYELDIVKCKKMYYNERVRRRRHIKWGALFSCTSIEEMIPILEDLIPRREMLEMIDDLYNITAPGKVISEREAMRLDDMFRRSLKLEGRDEGIEQTKIDIIKSMLSKKIAYKDISDITGKSTKEIKEIEKSTKD